jgi:hypothetical protein
MNQRPPDERSRPPHAETCSEGIIADLAETARVDRTIRPVPPGVKLPRRPPPEEAPEKGGKDD